MLLRKLLSGLQPGSCTTSAPSAPQQQQQQGQEQLDGYSYSTAAPQSQAASQALLSSRSPPRPPAAYSALQYSSPAHGHADPAAVSSIGPPRHAAQGQAAGGTASYSQGGSCSSSSGGSGADVPPRFMPASSASGMGRGLEALSLGGGDGGSGASSTIPSPAAPHSAAGGGDQASQTRQLALLTHRLRTAPSEDSIMKLIDCTSSVSKEAWSINFGTVGVGVGRIRCHTSSGLAVPYSRCLSCLAGCLAVP